MSKAKRQQQKWGIRFRILEQDNFRCHWCGVPAREAKLVLDHVMPLAANGDDHARNMWLAANRAMAGKEPASWKDDGSMRTCA